MHSSSSPQSSWTIVGIGIRVAQDVGAHRRKVYNAPLSVESELWKRAFWYDTSMPIASHTADEILGFLLLWIDLAVLRLGGHVLSRMRSKRPLHFSFFVSGLIVFTSSFDLELPLEVDDDFWEHPDPAKAFKQPPGLPCSIAYFNSFLKLNQILAFALRTIVSKLKSYPSNHNTDRSLVFY